MPKLLNLPARILLASARCRSALNIAARNVPMQGWIWIPALAVTRNVVRALSKLLDAIA
jgi:hypothetical protein